jgi:hypothetical protein
MRLMAVFAVIKKGGQAMITSIYPDADVLGEPTLEELFAEPIVRLIMKRDGVEDKELRGQIERVRKAYRALEKAQ